MARTFTAASSMRLSAAAIQISAYPFTMSIWFRPNGSTSGGFRTLFALNKADATGFSRYEIYTDLSLGVNVFRHDNSNATGGAVTTAALTSGTWGHCCAVFTSSTSATIYLDGGNSATDTTAVAFDNPDRTTIGQDERGALNYTEGDLAEAAIWDVALTAAEIASLAKKKSPTSVRHGSLVNYAQIIGRNSPEMDVVSGTSFTLVNAPTVTDHPPIINAHRRAIIPAAVIAASTPVFFASRPRWV
jgi:hypothetical protein